MKIKEFLLMRVAGKFGMVKGVLGIYVVLFYDKFVDRAWDIGFWQIFALCICLGEIILGYIVDDFTRDIGD